MRRLGDLLEDKGGRGGGGSEAEMARSAEHSAARVEDSQLAFHVHFTGECLLTCKHFAAFQSRGSLT